MLALVPRSVRGRHHRRQILSRIGDNYVRVFTMFGLIALAAAVIAFLFVPRLKRMMAGVH